MKIATTVCEYNPFHNGHVKHLNYIKETVKPDCLIVFMSGNFVQRGDIAVADKYKRAVWGIKGGADLIIELPTPFAVGNAETFASGAVKMMSALNVPSVFCFGAETGSAEAFKTNARYFINESKDLKSLIKENLNNGESLVRAKYLALKTLNPTGFDENLFENPNNILGLEYTKAILKNNADIEILPLEREAIHGDDTLRKKITSASSIRKAIGNTRKGKLKGVLPDFVYDDLPDVLPDMDKPLMTTVLTSNPEEMKKVPDCTEGLENRIKYLCEVNTDYKTALNKITTKRYTETRIRRICVNNMLKITDRLVKDALTDDLYFKVLATDKSGLEVIGELKNKAKYPFLTRKSEYSLKDTAKEVFEKDALSCKLYSLFTDSKVNEFATEILGK